MSEARLGTILSHIFLSQLTGMMKWSGNSGKERIFGLPTQPERRAQLEKPWEESIAPSSGVFIGGRRETSLCQMVYVYAQMTSSSSSSSATSNSQS